MKFLKNYRRDEFYKPMCVDNELQGCVYRTAVIMDKGVTKYEAIVTINVLIAEIIDIVNVTRET